LQHRGRTRPLDRDQGGEQRGVVDGGVEPGQSLGNRRGNGLAVGGVGHHQEMGIGEPVDDQVVEHGAGVVADHRVVRPPHRQPTRRGHQRKVECRRCAAPLYVELAHVGEIKETGSVPDCDMLLDQPGVLNRHFPAGEGNHPGAEGAVSGIERSLEHGNASGKGARTSTAR
jgi:hypothetical protein